MAPFAQYKGGKSTDGDQPEEGNRRSLRATKTPGHKAEHMVTHGEPLKLAVKKKTAFRKATVTQTRCTVLLQA